MKIGVGAILAEDVIVAHSTESTIINVLSCPRSQTSRHTFHRKIVHVQFCEAVRLEPILQHMSTIKHLGRVNVLFCGDPSTVHVWETQVYPVLSAATSNYTYRMCTYHGAAFDLLKNADFHEFCGGVVVIGPLISEVMLALHNHRHRKWLWNTPVCICNVETDHVQENPTSSIFCLLKVPLHHVLL